MIKLLDLISCFLGEDLVREEISGWKKSFSRCFRFQNRRMKWRNTKEREMLMSTKSMHSNSQLSDDCQEKDEFIRPFSPSSIDNLNEIDIEKDDDRTIEE